MTRALIFDSGVGGLSVVHALQALAAPITLDYLADSAWLPYGEKPDDALRARIPALLAAAAQDLSPDVVVLACNTAGTLALAETRAALLVPVVGVVPAVKPAATLTRSGVIGLLATPATVRRPYTDRLIADHAQGVTVLRAGTADLVRHAEDVLAGAPLDQARIRAALAPLLDAPEGSHMDVVVLACTHFPLLREGLERAAPGVAFIDSGEAVARRVLAVTGVEAASGETVLGQGLFTSDQAAGPLRRQGFRPLRRVAAEPPFLVEPCSTT